MTLFHEENVLPRNLILAKALILGLVFAFTDLGYQMRTLLDRDGTCILRFNNVVSRSFVRNEMIVSAENT